MTSKDRPREEGSVSSIWPERAEVGTILWGLPSCPTYHSAVGQVRERGTDQTPMRIRSDPGWGLAADLLDSPFRRNIFSSK